jgi:hypothetical protein
MSDFSDAAKRVSRLRDNLEDGHERATKESMGTMQTGVQSAIRGNDSVARGVLVNDVSEGELPSATAMVARAVGVPEWGKFLEHGTGSRGGRTQYPDDDTYSAPSPLPPLDPILTWVVAKNLTPDEYDSQYALAEAIARTIGEEGTFPHPFLRPTWYSPSLGYRNVIDENVRAMRRALRRF